MSDWPQKPGEGSPVEVPGFPHAPPGWSADKAEQAAAAEQLELDEDHWEAVRALQEYYANHAENAINVRGCTDALNEKFHYKGGLRYVYTLFPAGPIAQGCRVAGLQPPAGSTDQGFGSVQ